MTLTETSSGIKVFRKDLWFKETEYEPHLGQQVIHYDRTRHKAVVNGRRWGKTLMGGKEAEATAFVKNRFGEPQHGWIVGPEFKDCEKEFRVLYNTLKSLGLEPISPKFLNNVDNGNMHIKLPWGFEVECRSAKTPENLTGEGLDWVLMVEAGKQKRKTWTEYIRPALSDKRGWSLHTGVPEGATETSLLYALYQRGQDKDKRAWASWQMPSWTNTVVFPGGRQDPEILDAEDDLTEEEFRRQYGAEFVDRIGRVMKEWDDDLHIADLEFNRDWPLYLAIDYGYTNPFVLLWIQVDQWNNVYVIREDRFLLKDTTEIANEVQANVPSLLDRVTAFFPDPAEPDDTATLQRVWRKPARMNTGGELKTRLAMIRKSLKLQNPHLPDKHPDKRPTLLIDRECKPLIWEMREGYRWPEHKSEQRNDSENPMDKDNHGPEALGRFFRGFFGVVESEGRGSRIHSAKMRR